MSTTILACPPVDRAEQLKIGVVAFKPGPDMERGICSQCQAAVWIGPQARAYRVTNPSTRVLCLGCAARAAGQSKIQHLGGAGGRYLFDPAKVPRT